MYISLLYSGSSLPSPSNYPPPIGIRSLIFRAGGGGPTAESMEAFGAIKKIIHEISGFQQFQTINNSVLPKDSTTYKGRQTVPYGIVIY